MSECNNILRNSGKPYPRTCKICKFGPCLMESDSDNIHTYIKEGEKMETSPKILENTRALVIGAMEKDRIGGARMRDYVEEQLSPLGIKVWNHYKSPIECSINEGDDDIFSMLEGFREDENYEAIAKYKQIRHNDLALIDKCDFVICELNMETFSCGTFEEVFLANRHKKPIFLFCKQGKKSIPIWMWWTLPTNYFYNDCDEIVDTLSKIHFGQIKIDSDRWKLLKKELR